MEATKMSTNRGMNKEYVLHIYIERCIYKKDIKAIKAIKRWNNAICSNMDGPRDCHTDWSWLEKDKYYLIPLICGI